MYLSIILEFLLKIYILHFILTTTTADGSNNCDKDCKYGGVNFSGNYFGYALKKADKTLVDKLAGTYANLTCNPASDEGVILKYILAEHLFVPVELLINCGQFESRKEKSAAVLKHIEKFSSTVHANPLLRITPYTCQDRYDRPFLPFFGNGFYCPFEEIIYSLNGGNFLSFRTEFVDLLSLTNFYEFLDSTMESVFEEPEQPCGKDPEDIFLNFCRITSVTHSEPRGLANLYRMRCCCQNPEKCAEQQRSSNLAFCRYDTQVFAVDKFAVKLSNSMRSYKYKTIVNIDSLPKVGSEEQRCYATIIIERDLKNRTKDSGVLAINYGQKCATHKQAADRTQGYFCGPLYNLNLEPVPTDLRLCCWTKSKNQTSPGRFNAQLPAMLLNGILFEKIGDLTTENRILSKGIQNLWGDCIYLSGTEKLTKQSICYFTFDQHSKQAINVRNGENFHAFGFNKYFPEKLFDRLIGEKATSACINFGGCELKDNKTHCTNAEQFYFFCSCLQTQKLFCDYDLFLDVRKDIYKVNIYVPFCNVGNIYPSNASLTSWAPQFTTENFFCYERLFFIESVDPNTKPQAAIELGFFNLNMLGGQKEHKGCVSSVRKNKCLQLEDGSYFCCCLAPLDSLTAKAEHLELCNTGKDVQLFTDESTLVKPKFLSNTLKDQRLCEDNSFIMKEFEAEDMGLGLKMPAMCYFSMPINKTGVHVDDVKSYFVNLEHDKGNNQGIFGVLCKKSLWSPDEQTKGCKCSLLETPFEGTVSSKTTDILCCCVARMAERNKELMFRAKKPFKTAREFESQ